MTDLRGCFFRDTQSESFLKYLFRVIFVRPFFVFKTSNAT